MDGVKGLGSVSDTLLIPLYCRAYESKSKNPIIVDKMTEQIYEKLKNEIKDSPNKIHQRLLKNKYKRNLIILLSMRARRFDSYVRRFLKDNPDGVVVSFGSGLDTRFFRIDNGRLNWYDIDLPAVVELRERYIPQNERCQNIAMSILDFRWMDRMDKNRKALFLAEGVLMYLNEKDVRELFVRLQKEFPGSEIACEVFSRSIISKMDSRFIKWKLREQLGFAEDCRFSFGIENGGEIEKWSPGIKLLDEWSFYDDKEKKLGWMNVLRAFPKLRKMQWIVRYRLT